ncbi:MAG: tripartite tricarboxylate transporter substrate binding protein [Betaproteobacteria bacterium]|nr:tripartite tricarboxylate transporter substrate binding protein [Betaproteobacteria bacterium]
MKLLVFNCIKRFFSVRHFVKLSIGAAALCASACAVAQSYPSKPIRIVVPFPPGAIDIYVRLIQSPMEKDLGQPVVVDNRPGATGFIGAEIVARAPPDGYTLVATASGSIVVGWLVAARPPFDTLRDFTPITRIYNTPGALVGRLSLPHNSLGELVEHAKRNPGKLSHGSTGIGGTQHVDAEAFQLAAGVDFLHVPFNGFGPVVQALLGEQVDIAFTTLGVARPLARSGKVKMLGVFSGNPAIRPAGLNVPYINDVYPSYQPVDGWIGILAPAGLPRPLLQRLNAVAVKALNTPDVRAKVEEGGAIVVADSPEQFAAAMKVSVDDTARFLKMARAAGVKFE